MREKRYGLCRTDSGIGALLPDCRLQSQRTGEANCRFMGVPESGLEASVAISVNPSACLHRNCRENL